ncbi:MAG: acyl-CoA thioesterase [Gemmatimonadales bacterium]
MQWGEMDEYGHVNNAVFFRYFESARIEYLTRIGFIDSFDEAGVGAILHSTSCRFRSPLRFPQTVRVGVRVVSLDDDRFTHQYVVFDETDAVVAEGTGVVVSFDYRNGRKISLPAGVAERIRELGVAQ